MKMRKIYTYMSDKITKFTGSIPSIIIHTILFIAFLLSPVFGFDFQKAMILLTTIVSLEAIYLALFIQMSINKQQEHIEEISEDVEEISEEIEEIGEDVENIEKDIDEIQEDVEDISEDVGEISEDVEDLQEDIKEGEDEEVKEEARKQDQKVRLEKMEYILQTLLTEFSELKKK